ncbi:MAG: hypothetical protein GDA52_11425 [Rhodobacteraceae bacterium]|nr:hypothetical protein [Paracoccaceae bacterium]
MATRKWKVRIRLSKSGGIQQTVYVDADYAYNAKLMIEAQYGAGCIVGGSPQPA